MDDEGNLPVVRLEKVKCKDGEGNEFVNEWCDKEITCSKWGFAGDEKCKR